MLPLRHTLTVLGLALLFSSTAHAAETSLTLKEAQVRALGIDIQPVQAFALRGTPLPARVIVPTAQMRVVAAPLGGLVETLLLAPGEPVRKGQELARLNSRELLELQRDATQATSQSSLQAAAVARDEKLFAEGLIAESRLQASRAAARQAAAQASEREQGLRLSGGQAGQLSPTLSVRAPIDGVVLEQMAQAGQRVDAATPLYRIARLQPLWLEVQAPVSEAARLKVGQTLRLPGLDLGARLIAIGRAVDPGSQSVLLRAEVRQGAERLIPGQMLSVELPEAASAASGESRPQRLPASAVIRDGEQHLIFVLEGTAADPGERRFSARPVRIRGEGGDSLTVDGLRGDEKIVVRGTSGLKAMLTGVGRE